ncbi:peptidase M28-like protein [Flavobacteriaceae bacterium MAR_2009_75]|nr:peptidase M28-like protein [Flavobacteriaceae bacterium MAR_2009_75]
MKKIPALVLFGLMALAVYWVFYSATPIYTPDSDAAKSQFSTDRALQHVKIMASEPHAVGFPAHAKVRSYILAQLEKLGLQTEIQEGYTIGGGSNLSKASNILARIEGSSSGKALLLLSHYDSNPHSSLGASDAASGVATILEGVRAFLSEGKKPKNDIIILISDAEELGLNGADLFVNKHRWAKDVGLVLNFEARGSGGPSYAFIETNRGNQNLIREFIKANPKYPMANSLYYSIYKLLPNDTDLTVFRKDRDIEGFNFAFIDDHFDYHTAQDTYARLDKNTLAHQGSYLMPLLHHFSATDLGNLKSLNDYVYFNIPFFEMVAYPFDWIWPMLVLASLLFIAILAFGFKKKVLHLRALLMGFVPMLAVLVINAVAGYFVWPLLKWVYPEYQDILHGFTYNGYIYIVAMVMFSLTTCFFVYRIFNKATIPNLLFAPLLLWLAICGGVALYLPGASFFIVPVFALLTMWYVSVNQKEPHALLLLFLALPALWLYAPFIKGFAVGLGLKMLVASALLVSLTFFLTLPVFGLYNFKKGWAKISFIVCIAFLVYAHFESGFDKENKRPNSLVYILDADRNSAHWATYDNVLTDWNKGFFQDLDELAQKLSTKTISSKYGTHFTKMSVAPVKSIVPPEVETLTDSIIGEHRLLKIRISPQRPINRLDFFTNDTKVVHATANGLALDEHYLKNRRPGKLLTHYVSDEKFTELELTVTKASILELTVYEASNDLMNHALFDIPVRPENNIPMPFVLNDAVMTVKKIRYE